MTALAPEDICREVYYRPDWEPPYQMWGPRSLADVLMKLLNEPEIPLSVSVSKTEKDGVPMFLFGSSVPEDMLKIAAYFGKNGDTAAAEGYVHPKVLGASHGLDEPRIKYPFHELLNVGDHFFVPGGKRQNIAVYASNYTRWTGSEKMITVREVPGGVLVLLLWGPDAQFKRTIMP